MHVTVFYYNMDGCTEPGNFSDWTKILTSAGDMVQNVFNNDTAKLLTAVRRGSVDVPTQYRHASDPHRQSKKHELRLTQYR